MDPQLQETLAQQRLLELQSAEKAIGTFGNSHNNIFVPTVAQIDQMAPTDQSHGAHLRNHSADGMDHFRPEVAGY